MTTAAEWQAGVGRNWAATWRQTDRAFAGITEHLLELIGNLPGREVLDVGCGAGELALAIARQRAGAAVTGIDISEDLIAAARERGARGLVQFVHADATQYRPAKAPDLLVSRHGVMFFDDPLAAFTHLRSIAAPGARMAFSCFRDVSENTWATEPAAAVGAPFAIASGYAPGPFGLRDPEFTRGVLAEAGWAGIRVEPLEAAFVMGQGESAARQAAEFMKRIGPSARALAELEPAAQDEANERLRALAARHCSESLVAFPAAVWLVTARN